MFNMEEDLKKDEQKKILQERFLQMLKEKKQKNKQTNTEVKQVNWEEKYRREKKRRREVELRCEKLEKKMKIIQEEKNVSQEKVLQTKAKSLEFHQKNLEMTENLKRAKQELTASINRVSELEIKCASLESELNKINIVSLEKQKSKLLSENSRLKVSNQNYKKKIRILEQKLRTNNTISQVEKNENQKIQIQRLNEKMRKLKHRLHNFEVNMHPDFLIELMDEHITEENLSLFFTNKKNKLSPLVEKLNKMKIEQKRNARKQTKNELLQDLKEIKKDERCGYISSKDGKWYFIDVIENNLYQVSNNVSGKELIQEQPVKVVMEKGKATILKIYNEVPSYEETVFVMKQKNSKTPISVAEPVEYPFLGSYSVLIIGSRNLHEYRNRLEKHGLEVELHNPFEENYARIQDKFNRADIVLVCTSHVSHAALECFDKEDKKVELIKTDNVESIVARTRFVIINSNPTNNENDTNQLQLLH